jgi:preprotein translocase subunit SecA
MTGTAETSKEEFQKVYGLNVVSIPTHREVRRIDHADVVYQTEKAKWVAITEKVKELHDQGRPILIGTTSIEKNEKLAQYLERAGVPFEMLNAKNHERESEIIAGAGKKGSVVVATNMAGRGVDIKLGGPQASAEEKEEVRNLGGLFVIGTERHEARRIDNQLRGRSGRQGDLGETQFYVSLEDEIMKRFGGDNMKSMMQKLNVPEDMPIESGMVSRMIETSQKKIEGFYFDIRKQVLQYDAVLNTQRDSIYTRRGKILNSDLAEMDKMLSEIEQSKPEITDLRSKVEERVGKEQFLLGLRTILLQSIDIHWMDHLDTMEHLRSSVSLRGYGQHDPLVEYKREGLAMFKQLEANIGATASNFLFHSLKESLQMLEGGVVLNVQQPAPDLQNLPNIDTNKIGRNDPCPCGSGKKYKNCHGKNA